MRNLFFAVIFFLLIVLLINIRNLFRGDKPAEKIADHLPGDGISGDFYTSIIKHAESISVCFHIEQSKPLAVGERMKGIYRLAHMNGYNWDAFFRYYLPKYAPDICANMTADPEAGMYSAHYPLTPQNEARAERFAILIRELVEGGEELCRIVREESDKIEWN
ncbi:MAG: immunity 51 family protein [Oscillospiraceae bacterium]|nr:immunity 51 family protein [Oscillospiraceae bacterium]